MLDFNTGVKITISDGLRDLLKRKVVSSKLIFQCIEEIVFLNGMAGVLGYLKEHYDVFGVPCHPTRNVFKIGKKTFKVFCQWKKDEFVVFAERYKEDSFEKSQINPELN